MAAATSTTTISQISCFPSISRKFQLQRRSHSVSSITLRSKLSVSSEGRIDASASKFKAIVCHVSDASKPSVDGIGHSYPSIEEPVAAEMDVGENVQDQVVAQQKKAAKIHDFCFGIPYGGLVLSGGLLGFIFARNSANVSIMLFGGALLALSTFSLKIWSQGKSSLLFILGQAALAAGLTWKSFQSYAMTKKLFPTGLYGVISSAMLCFYSYVLLSGGNPPPKKLKASANIST